MKPLFSISALLGAAVFTTFITTYAAAPAFANAQKQAETAASSKRNVAITPISGLQRGVIASVRGEVVQITDDDEFLLRDATGSVRVYVGPNPVPAKVGEQVTVRGLVDDDKDEPKEIYAKILTRADGSIVEFDHEDY
ncbi:MAG: NirD/YgiW/YdeI family stress tolerance protein [Alphaproteobacteria bacterium]